MTDTYDIDSYPSWYGIVGSWGYEVVDFSTFGSYQGDHAVLLSDGSRWGWLVIGYGSCSGCDALEAATDWSEPYWNDDVRALADGTRESVHWDSASGLADYLESNLQENDWYYYEDGYKDHVASVVARLRAEDA